MSLTPSHNSFLQTLTQLRRNELDVSITAAQSRNASTVHHEAERRLCDQVLSILRSAKPDEPLSLVIEGPHDSPVSCPTYWNGCWCTVRTLEANIQRAKEAEDKAVELKAKIDAASDHAMYPDEKWAELSKERDEAWDALKKVQDQNIALEAALDSHSHAITLLKGTLIRAGVAVGYHVDLRAPLAAFVGGAAMGNKDDYELRDGIGGLVYTWGLEKHNEYTAKYKELQAKRDEWVKEKNHWKANHADVVRKKQEQEDYVRQLIDSIGILVKWKHVIREGLVMWNEELPENPREAIHKLIEWEKIAALDPAVSKEAADLRDTYKNCQLCGHVNHEGFVAPAPAPEPAPQTLCVERNPDEKTQWMWLVRDEKAQVIQTSAWSSDKKNEVIEDARKWCRKHGWAFHDIYVDTDDGATSMRVPVDKRRIQQFKVDDRVRIQVLGKDILATITGVELPPPNNLTVVYYRATGDDGSKFSNVTSDELTAVPLKSWPATAPLVEAAQEALELQKPVEVKQANSLPTIRDDERAKFYVKHPVPWRRDFAGSHSEPVIYDANGDLVMGFCIDGSVSMTEDLDSTMDMLIKHHNEVGPQVASEADYAKAHGWKAADNEIGCCPRCDKQRKPLGFNGYCSFACERNLKDHELSLEQLTDKYNFDGDGEYEAFTRFQWRRAVALEDTSCGYWDWVHNQILIARDDETERT